MCICVHAKQNALLQAARLGYTSDAAACYTTLRPCFGCLKELRQAGVAEVRCLDPSAPSAPALREAGDELLALARRTRHAHPAARAGTRAARPARGGRRVKSAEAFLALAIGLVVIAAAAARAHVWIAAVAATVLALWLGSIAVPLAKHRSSSQRKYVPIEPFAYRLTLFASVSNTSLG